LNLIERIGDAPVFYAIRILVLLVLLAVVGLAAGCAQIKTCEVFTVYASHDGRGNPLYAIDQENIEKLANTLNGLNEGTCRIEK
jgi:hypothetical protein